ncbi:hypothetical protein R3P38DRAFT_3543321 [Favolaschia claudopus]|uniref:HNH nuclease domain-containing protein n=1 Tax=Favolaschia claudopus TaxID=2862362 RepID=A0AAW0B7A1_9AGAR
MPPQSLPVIDAVQLDDEGLSLWPTILRAEAAAADVAPKFHSKYNNNLIAVRVLGFLLQDFWQHNAQSFGLIPYHRLCQEITSSLRIPDVVVGSEDEAKKQNNNMYELGLLYRNHIMRVFRSNTGPLPATSEHPSPPSIEQFKARIIAAMETPQTTSDARKHALLRDGHRCMLTGVFDYYSCKEFPELRALANASGAKRGILKCAHIFSDSAKEEYAASAIAILTMFGLHASGNKESLIGGNVNKHFNLITMVDSLHTLFHRLEFWFEEVIGEPDTYDICSSDAEFFAVVPAPPRRVTFAVDPDVAAVCKAQGKDAPQLPSPALLAVRAACSRVAHISGAVEQADQILRDLEDISALAEDGSTADLFTSRLLQLLPGTSIRVETPVIDDDSLN